MAAELFAFILKCFACCIKHGQKPGVVDGDTDTTDTRGGSVGNRIHGLHWLISWTRLPYLARFARIGPVAQGPNHPVGLPLGDEEFRWPLNLA